MIFIIAIQIIVIINNVLLLRERQTYKQTGRQTDRKKKKNGLHTMIGIPTDRHTGRQTDRQTGMEECVAHDDGKNERIKLK